VRAFFQLYRTNWREFWRDRSALFWTLAFPIFFMLLFGAVFDPRNAVLTFTVGLVNQGGPASAPLVESIRQTDCFKLTEGDWDSEWAALERGDRNILVVVRPADSPAVETAALTTAVSQTAVDIYYDPVDQNTANLAVSIINKLVSTTNETLSGAPPAITVSNQQASGTYVSYAAYMLPGIIAIALMQVGLTATTGPMIHLRERGVLRRMRATPLSTVTLLGSQIVFRLTISLVQAAILLAIGMYVFDIQIALHNWPGILALVLLGTSTFIILGYGLSVLVRTEEAIQGAVLLPTFLFMFISGCLMPMEVTPKSIQPLIDAVPLTYLGDALRALILETRSYYSLTRSILVLAVWSVVCLALVLKYFRWEPHT
jgi:ABC-2 type transport system permease protein